MQIDSAHKEKGLDTQDFVVTTSCRNLTASRKELLQSVDLWLLDKGWAYRIRSNYSAKNK